MFHLKYLHVFHLFSDLLHCTEEPNVSIPTLANLLIERTQSQNWITVFKGLVTLHHMMCYGNERFIQYLASSNTNFQLSSFLDKSAVHGKFFLCSKSIRDDKSQFYFYVVKQYLKVRKFQEEIVGSLVFPKTTTKIFLA